MSLDATTIDVYRLMTLLNELYRAGKSELAVSMPYLEKPIFALRLLSEDQTETPSEVSFLPRFREYQNFLDKLPSRSGAREVPDYGMLQALLLQAGIVDYPNFNEFLAKLHQLCQRDFHKGDRPVFLGLDTNLFRDRFYSAHYQVLEHIPDNKIGFSVSPNVKDELTFDKRKYKAHDLRALAELCKHSHFRAAVEDFFNQSCLHDRLCRLGFVELDKVKRIHWIDLLPELDEKELERSPDLNIIKTYKLAAAERNVDILLLSRDDAFIGHAEGIPGLLTFQIQKPHVRGQKFKVAKWRHLCQLLYLATVVCGAIRVDGVKESFLLKGIWKGKRSQDWNFERLRIAPLSSKSVVFNNCLRAWRVLDAREWRPFA